MKCVKGFSLMEVLVSLLLAIATSLAFLHQQWQLSQLFNQALLRVFACMQLDNNVERMLAKQPLASPEKPFRLSKTESNQEITFQLLWVSPTGKMESLQRHIGRLE